MPLSQPPLENDGSVTPHDHPGIRDEDGIIRRISAEFVVTDASTGVRRLSSMAFKPSSGAKGGMSIDLEALILEAGVNPIAHVTTPRFMGSVRFTARHFRAEGLSVGYDPLPDNPFHGEIWGRFSKGVQRKLQAAATWYVPIEKVSLT